MLSSNVACSYCESLVSIIAKKVHPELDLGPVYECKELPPGENKTIVAMFYFSDTVKKNIYNPIYDMDVLLIDSKTHQILSHFHEKRFIQEAGVKSVSTEKNGDDYREAYNSDGIFTNYMFISFIGHEYRYKLADSIETFGIILSRKNNSSDTSYVEDVLNLYYFKNNAIHKVLGSFRLLQEEKGINLGNNIAKDTRAYCSLEVDKNQTFGFNNFIVNEKKQVIEYSTKDIQNDTNKKTNTKHRFILTYNGHEYEVPEICKAR